jgi:hypothetical protein
MTALKNAVFWDVMPCSVVEVFLGTVYCLHLQGQRVSQARNQEEASSRSSANYGRLQKDIRN